LWFLLLLLLLLLLNIAEMKLFCTGSLYYVPDTTLRHVMAFMVTEFCKRL
jgi:hypothetical protein